MTDATLDEIAAVLIDEAARLATERGPKYPDDASIREIRDVPVPAINDHLER